MAIFSRCGVRLDGESEMVGGKTNAVPHELHQEVGQQNRLTCILQNLLIPVREKEQVLHQQDDAFRFGSDTPQRRLVFGRRAFLQQADLTLPLDGRNGGYSAHGTHC